MSKNSDYFVDVHPSHKMEKYRTPNCYKLRCTSCDAECYEDYMVADPNMTIRNRERLEGVCAEDHGYIKTNKEKV